MAQLIGLGTELIQSCTKMAKAAIHICIIFLFDNDDSKHIDPKPLVLTVFLVALNIEK